MDATDAVANQTLAEKYLKKFGAVLEEHNSKLIQLLDDHTGGKDKGDENISSTGRSHSAFNAYPVAYHIWEQNTNPIQLSWVPIQENCGFEEIISIPLPPDGNPDVQKVLLVLTNLTSQLMSMRKNGFSKIIPPLVLYGEGFESEVPHPSSSVTEGEGHVAIAKFLPFLYEVQKFIKIGTELCIHWLAQMGALFKDSKPHVVSISTLRLPTVFREFGDFIGMLVIFDEILSVRQSVLQEHWIKYRQMIKSVQADCNSFGADSHKLLQLEKELFILNREVITGQIFKYFLIRVNQQGAKGLGKAMNLSEKFQSHLAYLSSSLEKDFMEGNDTLKPIAIGALFVFASTLFPSTLDWKKFFHKTILEPMKKVPAVPVGGSVLWIPEIFFNSYSLGNVKLLDSRTMQSFSINRQTYLQQKVAGLDKSVLNYSMQVGTWAVKLQELFYSKSLNELKIDDLSRRCNLLLQGVKHAQILSQNFRLIMNLHANLQKPVTKKIVGLLYQLQELLKEVQNIFFRYSVQICNSAIYIVQNVLHTTLSHIKSVQKLLSSPDLKKMDEIRSDSLAVLKIFENSMRGPPSEKRLLIAKITLDWALASSRHWKEDDAVIILPAAIERISSIVEIEQKIEDLCSGSSLFWHRIVLPNYFSAMYANEVDSLKLPLMFMVLQDCYKFLDKSPHKEQAKKAFVTEIKGYLKMKLFDKICQDLETDLRLLAHSHLQVESGDSTSPFRVGVKEHKYFMECPTLSFDFENCYNFKLMTEYYLSKTFYNLASVALHDWQSYATMRALAADKYQLEVVDDHLPGHSLEQGRDILEIVRNLPKFVQEFTYNLNNQVFIQVASQNKHLDTVNIRHLANSMRTHGPGMANTTVNSTYQFLRPKLHTFSQFLYEEQIRSRLSKDIRLFKQSTQESSANNPVQQTNFPFKLADKFKKGIRKLGIQDGLTWLDHFRILITQIGNALGFVRLVRSGGLHFLAGGCRFVPDLEDVIEFQELSETGITSQQQKVGDFLMEELKSSAVAVDSTLKTLTSSFSGGVDYFKLLVGAFSSACQNERNSHLKNFYIIIPALTLSYVDHMRLCKEMLAKKSKSASVFTDDGFPMGVAYLLQVLGQDGAFDSLGWFSAVKLHYDEEKKKEVQSMNESRNDEKLEQASKLTAKRFQDQLQEFELLRYNLSSARIFFQHDNQIPQK